MDQGEHVRRGGRGRRTVFDDEEYDSGDNRVRAAEGYRQQDEDKAGLGGGYDYVDYDEDAYFSKDVDQRKA